MTILAQIIPHPQDVPTMAWLIDSGVSEAKTWEEHVRKLGVFDIQLNTVPAILKDLSEFEEPILISRITSRGVTFYLTNIPFTMCDPAKRRKLTTDWADGSLLVPMSNVVCINSFGSVAGKSDI
jgi:hypothetical protein